jgi:hypothetical protein
MAAGTVLQSFCTHCQGPLPENVRMFCTGCMALGKPVLAILHGGGRCGVGADKKPHVAGSHEIWCYDCAVSPGFPQRGQPAAHGEQQEELLFFLEQGGEMNAHDHAPAAAHGERHADVPEQGLDRNAVQQGEPHAVPATGPLLPGKHQPLRLGGGYT